jgi:ADP-heptose:LPS heptosyltransferase
MPNWLGDVVMTFPLIDAIRRGRPDAEITLIAKPQFKELFKNLNIGDNYIDLPYESGVKAYAQFLDKRGEYGSLIINLSNSLRSDIECFLLGIPRRYGLKFRGRFRPLLTHSFLHNSKGSPRLHQVQLWKQMLNFFGLNERLSYKPFNLSVNPLRGKIGIFPGSANQPSKRWPLGYWEKLISRLLDDNSINQIHVFGTKKESEGIDLLIKRFSSERIYNQCGETNLWGLAQELASCEKVIGNDSGGLHLANLLGINTTILFGPTDPNVTAPLYDAPLKVVRSRGADGHLSNDLHDLTVDQVFELI